MAGSGDGTNVKNGEAVEDEVTVRAGKRVEVVKAVEDIKARQSKVRPIFFAVCRGGCGIGAAPLLASPVGSANGVLVVVRLCVVTTMTTLSFA